MEDLEETVAALNNRIAYLERELDMSYTRNRFNRRMDRLLSTDEHTIDVSEGPYGYHARISDINGDDVQRILDRVDGISGLDCAVTETADGLGMEVWTGDEF